jgi:hypothetical protein
MADPNVVRHRLFSVQICVPAEFTDEQAIAAGEKLCPCGTEHGWSVAQPARLNGDPSRVTCEKYPENVHIVLLA